MTTTTKKGPQVRPAQKPSTEKNLFTHTAPDKKKLASEFKAIGKVGAYWVLHQSTGDEYYDPESGTIRAIRYCPKEKSVFVDEQREGAVTKPVIFENGRIFVPVNKPNLRKYLELHPGNKANGGNAFELVEPEKQAKREMEVEFAKSDAIQMIKTKPLSELLQVALAYNINTNREVDEIKHDLFVHASKNPEAFIKTFDDPETKVRAKVSLAFKNQIIIFERGAVRWYDTGTEIVRVPKGRKAADIATHYFMLDEAADVVAQIERQL